MNHKGRRGYSNDSSCANCGRTITAKDRQFGRAGVFCSSECADTKKSFCQCESPIRLTDEDGDINCFKCGRPVDAGVGSPSANQGQPSAPGGAADSGAETEFPAPTPGGPAPNDFDFESFMEEAA